MSESRKEDEITAIFDRMREERELADNYQRAQYITSAPQKTYQQGGPVESDAFIVNINNLFNLDADFVENLPSHFTQGASTSFYEYVVNERDRNMPQAHVKRISYKCRIRHVEQASNSPEGARDAARQLMRRIDRLNGWVRAKVWGRDRYGRIIVDLYDPHNGEKLSKWLADTFPDIVRSYSGAKRRNEFRERNRDKG